MYTEMILVGYALLLIVAGFLIGMFTEQVINKKQMEHRVYNCDDFCFNHCKIHESVYSSYDDPDDAWNELDGGNHCADCPIYYALDFLDEQALESYKNRRNKK